MSKSKREIAQHVLAWVILYSIWILFFGKSSFAITRNMTVQFCYLVFVAANYYFNVYWAIPRLLYAGRYRVFALSAASGILVTALCRVPLAAVLNKHVFIPGKPQPGLIDLFTSSLLNIFIWVALVLTVKLLADRYRLQQNLDAIQKEKEKAELDFLNAQLNPHFLFNSINSIYGHIDKQNGTARKMLLTFSEMLRYQLYECNTPAIPIDREIRYLRNYVQMQRSRKEESLVVELALDPRVTGFSVAPLLFIAFIENAFKYVGSQEDRQNIVKICFEKTSTGLLFKCCNSRERIPDNHITDKGIGISNARRRLNLLYPDRHSLQIQDEEDHYTVTINLQLP